MQQVADRKKERKAKGLSSSQKGVGLEALGRVDWERGRTLCVAEEQGLLVNFHVMIMNFVLGTSGLFEPFWL